MQYEDIRAALDAIGQTQLLRFYEELSPSEQQSLLTQISTTDFSCLSRFSEKDLSRPAPHVSPIRTLTRGEIRKEEAQLKERGLALLREGRAAAVLLAGGMGTRLGMSGPKGTCDIGMSRPVYIFERLIDNLLINVRAAGRPVRLFIMTSEANDKATRDFFEAHAYFGYDADYIRFFVQDSAPAVDDDGKVLLETKSRIASSPNGNGGWFSSMHRAGLTDLLLAENVEYLNVFNVDNVLQNICDPLFLGAVDLRGADSGAKVVQKSSPDEKTGVMCLKDGRASVIEYYEMTEDMRHEKDEEGNYVYSFGVIGNYLFRLSSCLKALDARLPLHFAHKAVPHVDLSGRPVKADQPDGWKFEYFIFDILASLKDCLPFEIERDKEFAPVKNKEGNDSVATAQALCLKNGIEL